MSENLDLVLALRRPGTRGRSSGDWADPQGVYADRDRTYADLGLEE
jgi:hypothetical protein